MSTLPPPPPPPQNPYEPPRVPSPGGGSAAAEQEVSGPATGLLVTGILGGLSAVANLVIHLFGLSGFGMEGIPSRFGAMFMGTLGIVGAGIGLVVAGFLIYAYQQMRSLTQWELCVAASVAAMVPCVSPCCIVGLPIGIWALVVLLKPEVKSAFR